MNGFVALARACDVPPGWVLAVRTGARTIAIANRDGEILALDGRCSHAGGPLGDGRLDDGCVRCPWHEGRFDAATGAVVEAPPRRPVRTYPTQVRDGVVWVDLDTPGSSALP